MVWKHGFSAGKKGFCGGNVKALLYHLRAYRRHFPRLGAGAVSFEFNHAQFVEAEQQAKAFFGTTPDPFPEYADEEPMHGPARGILFALPVGILMWVGIIAVARSFWH